MDTLMMLNVVMGGILIVLLAGCAHDDSSTGLDSPPPAERLKYLASGSGLRTESGVDLDSLKCSYIWAFEAKSFLDICIPDGDKELKEDLKDEVAAIAQFLVANSSQPDVTKQRLELDTKTLQAEAAAFLGPKIDQACSEVGSGQKAEGPFLKALRGLSRKQRRASVAKLLTEPSPPLQMCFP